MRLESLQKLIEVEAFINTSLCSPKFPLCLSPFHNIHWILFTKSAVVRCASKMKKLYHKKELIGAAALILMVYFLCFYSVLYKNSDLKQIEREENKFLNLTNFRYIIQPTDAICNSSSEELDGKLKKSNSKSKTVT